MRQLLIHGHGDIEPWVNFVHMWEQRGGVIYLFYLPGNVFNLSCKYCDSFLDM